MPVRIHEYERVVDCSGFAAGGGKTYKHRKKRVNKSLMKGGWRCYETTNEWTGA